MKKLFSTKKRIAIAAAVAVVAIGASAAFAYWTTGGSGSGNATAGSTNAIVVNQTNPAITDLYPGGPGVALSGNFDNLTNPGPVYVTSVTAVVHPFTSNSVDPLQPNCTEGDFKIEGTSNTPGEIAHGAGQGSWSGLTVRLVDNTSANQDNCKGVTITIDYTANAL